MKSLLKISERKGELGYFEIPEEIGTAASQNSKEKGPGSETFRYCCTETSWETKTIKIMGKK